MVKKSITVTDQQERWIQAQMETGNYGTDSELIREALREKQLRVNEVEALRAKLTAAELSVEQHGWVEETRHEILDGFKEKARQDGKL
jgi:antitoxin ParD1/3/4